jgi:hypothetical protein
MNSYLVVLFVIAFIIFFRSDIGKLLNSLNAYRYLVMPIILVFLNYWLILDLTRLGRFLQIVDHLFNQAQLFIFGIFKHLPIDFKFNWSQTVVNLLILLFLIFYPYYYAQKRPSTVYYSEILSLNVLYIFFTIFFVFFVNMKG